MSDTDDDSTRQRYRVHHAYRDTDLDPLISTTTSITRVLNTLPADYRVVSVQVVDVALFTSNIVAFIIVDTEPYALTRAEQLQSLQGDAK